MLKLIENFAETLLFGRRALSVYQCLSRAKRIEDEILSDFDSMTAEQVSELQQRQLRLLLSAGIQYTLLLDFAFYTLWGRSSIFGLLAELIGSFLI